MVQKRKSPAYSLLVNGNERSARRIECRIGHSVDVPTQALRRNIAHRQADGHVPVVADVQAVQACIHSRMPGERLVELDMAFGRQLRFVPRAHVHRVERARGNVRAVGGVCDPPGRCGVDRRVGPSVNVDSETLGRDIADVGSDAPIGIIRHVKLAQPHDDRGRRVELVGECDDRGGLRPGLVGGMIVGGGELAKLKIRVLVVDLEPVATGAVEDGVTPGIEMDFDRFARRDDLRVSPDADVVVLALVECSETERKPDGLRGDLDNLAIGLFLVAGSAVRYNERRHAGMGAGDKFTSGLRTRTPRVLLAATDLT